MHTSPRTNVLQNAIFQCLRNITIFSELTTAELNIMAGQMHVLRSGPERMIFREDDPGDFVCFVVDGKLSVLKTMSGTEKTIAVLAAGQSIGEMAVVGNFPRSATVKTMSDATLLTLKRHQLNAICEDYPHIGVKVFKAVARLLSQHLRRTSEDLFELMPAD